MIFDQIITPSSKLKPWTLWTVDAHVNVRGNWMRLMDGDAGLFYSNLSFAFLNGNTRILSV